MKKDLQTLLSYTKPNGTCLEWTRCLNSDGYPRAVFDGYSNGKVHRVVYELCNSQLFPGEVVRHSCDNPKCINPEHLLRGTARDNVKDRDTRDRHGQAKLNHRDVRMIRDLWATGQYRQKTLAQTFNINTRTVSSLVLNKHWKSVK